MSKFLDTPLWVIIPAAGHGERMGASVSKQYMTLAGQTMLQRTVSRMLDVPDVAGVVVVLAADDRNWTATSVSHDSRVYSCTGGATRAESVVSGLQYVLELADANTWVMVHDAARPLVALSDIQRLLSAVYNSGSVGGLLATPVPDTLKKADEFHAIEQTVSRQDLWQAQTPQLFRSEQLLKALQTALLPLAQKDGLSEAPVSTDAPVVTDEASAMEMAGFAPLLVEALQPNFKITRPTDLQLAEAVIAQSGNSA